MENSHDGFGPRNPTPGTYRESDFFFEPPVAPEEQTSPQREPGAERNVLSTSTVWFIAAATLAVAAIVGLFAGVVGARLGGSGAPPPAAQVRVLGSTNEPVAAAAAAALPAVVNIDVTSSGSSGGSGSLPKTHPKVPTTGQGSGVAYKEAPGGGTYIVTNDHVVSNAKTIIITPPGGTQVSATTVGTDPETDIAVVKVPVRLPTIKVGQSDKILVGQLVVAIGSPFGLEHSVSSGIVSGTHRSLPQSFSGSSQGSYPLVDVIQTDAAINPGNSGGALVDRVGRLIGINSAIFSDTGQNAGIGFAIPAKTAVRVADELIGKGKVDHPFLGVLGQTATSADAKRLGLPAAEGALVVQVVKASTAEKAGIKVNDVVIALNGKPIRSMDDLVLAVRRETVGTKVTLTLFRAKKKMNLPMTIGNKPR